MALLANKVAIVTGAASGFGAEISRARDMILRQATRDGYELDVPGIVPKLSETPGTVRSSAPHLGDDTEAVLREVGLTPAQIAALREKGVIA